MSLDETQIDSAGKQLPETRCYECGYETDCATGVKTTNRPVPGSWSVCFECCALGVFTDELRLRAATVDERFEFQNEHPGLLKRLAEARAKQREKP